MKVATILFALLPLALANLQPEVESTTTCTSTTTLTKTITIAREPTPAANGTAPASTTVVAQGGGNKPNTPPAAETSRVQVKPNAAPAVQVGQIAFAGVAGMILVSLM